MYRVELKLLLYREVKICSMRLKLIWLCASFYFKPESFRWELQQGTKVNLIDFGIEKNILD